MLCMAKHNGMAWHKALPVLYTLTDSMRTSLQVILKEPECAKLFIGCNEKQIWEKIWLGELRC